MPDGAEPTETTPPETTIVASRAVSCDGGVGADGHPKVYLRIVDRQITCPYCSRLFVLKANAALGVTDAAH